MAVYYKVNETAVMAYTGPGGEVTGEVSDLSFSMREFARAFAPVRTGKLRRGIAHLKPVPAGPYRAVGGIAVNLKYARFVEYGTVGPIASKNGKKMRFRSNGGKGPFVYAESVRGQRPQFFMLRGFQAGMRMYKAGL